MTRAPKKRKQTLESLETEEEYSGKKVSVVQGYTFFSALLIFY